MNAFRCVQPLARSSTPTPATTLLRPSIPRLQSIKQYVYSPLFTASNLIDNVPSSSRAFSLLAPRRPIIPTTPNTFLPSSALPTTSILSAETLDLLPKISSHPGLLATQIRCGPRNTFNPSHFVRKRRHGFLARLRSRTGRKVLMRRKLKGRKQLSH